MIKTALSGVLTLVCLSGAPARAQQVFPGNPLPNTTNPAVINKFMQLDVVDAGNLHPAVDITANTGDVVRVPLAAGKTGIVQSVESDGIAISATDQQNGQYALIHLIHVVPNPSLSVGTPVTSSTQAGTIISGPGHLHLTLYLSSAFSWGGEDIVNPEIFDFSGSWKTDTYYPEIDTRTDYILQPPGQMTYWWVFAHDQENADPRYLNGIWALSLEIDGVEVDGFAFDKFLGKSGFYPPTASEYYYCTAPSCIPPTSGFNNPSVLEYKLGWLTQGGRHLWQIKAWDTVDNRAVYPDLPTGALASMGGEILDDGTVRLTWYLISADGASSFDVLQAPQEIGPYEKANTDPIAVLGDQQTYQFLSKIPEGWATVWYRLMENHADGTSVQMTETSVKAPPLIETVQVVPNPSDGIVTVQASLARTDIGRVAIYDPSGRRVKLLYSGALARGTQRWTWDATDSDGNRVSPGNYFLVIDASQAGERVVHRAKVAVVR